MKNRIAMVVLLLPVLLIMAAPAFANAAGWSFTMNLRYVNGADNGQTYSLTKGTMTNPGSIWVYEKLPGAIGAYNVTVAVRKQVLGPDPQVGSSTVYPGTTVGVKKGFNTSCGYQSAGTYYIEAWKAEVDGFRIKGAGTLTTK